MEIKNYLQVRGYDKEDNLHFTIVEVHGDGTSQGVDVNHKHFILQPDKSVKAVNYLQIKSAQNLERHELLTARDSITRAFNGILPYFMPFYEGM